MKVWVASFFVLFSLAEFYHWIEGIRVPLPVYLIGGLLLAIASNYEKGICSFLESEVISYDGEFVEQLVVNKNNLPDSMNNNDGNNLRITESKETRNKSISFKIKQES